MIFTLSTGKFYNTIGAAKVLDRSRFTIQKWCRQGRFEGAKKLGRDYVIPVAQVEHRKRLLENPDEILAGAQG